MEQGKINRSEEKNNRKPKQFVQVNFDIQKALKADMPKIEINYIDPTKSMEETKEFRKLLFYFNQIFESKLDTDGIMYSKTNFRSLYEFIFFNVAQGNIIIKKEIIPEFMEGVQKLQNKYSHNIRSLEKYYDEIVKTIFYPKGMMKKNKEVIRQMNLFDQAYSLMKVAFDKKKRKGRGKEEGERYFEHLRRSMEIILRELPNPNLNKIIIALLHDVVEDLPRYNIKLIETIYGKYIAEGVKELTKKAGNSIFYQMKKKNTKKLFMKKRYLLHVSSKILKIIMYQNSIQH